jgi:hypothetical protein
MMPPLSSPRSTHDAVVVGSKIYVVGGWSLPGGGSENAEFLDTALVFDLAQVDPAGQFESRLKIATADAGHTSEGNDGRNNLLKFSNGSLSLPHARDRLPPSGRLGPRV